MEARHEDPLVRLTPCCCGVVAGGRMGAGIVHALLLAGARVALVERDEEEVAAARERLVRAVNGDVMRAAYEGQISWLHAGRRLNGRPGREPRPGLITVRNR